MAGKKIRLSRFEDAWLLWSAWKLDAIYRCPLRAELAAILREERPMATLFAVGQALHYMAYRFFATERPYRSAKSFGRAWNGFWAGVVAGKHDPDTFRPPKPGEAVKSIAWENEGEKRYWFKKGRTAMESFFERHAPFRVTGTVQAIERPFKIESWHGFTLTGRLDRIDVRDEGCVIRDYKLGSYRFKDLFQARIYEIAYERCFRQQLFNDKPLLGIEFENFQSGKIHAVPLGTPDDFGKLYWYVTEASWYVRAILTGESPPAEVAERFRHFRLKDLELQTFVPNLPRGDHCANCGFVEDCLIWEEAHSHETAQSRWVKMVEARIRAEAPTQGVLPFTEAIPAAPTPKQWRKRTKQS